MKVPTMATSSTSMAATNSRTFSFTDECADSSTTGVRNVVSRTSQIEMPSMPSLKCAPSPGIHSLSNTSW